MTFKVGDEVEWTSQAGGRATTKRGQIGRVLQRLAAPFVSSEDHLDIHSNYKVMFDSIWARPHESYLVAVPAPGLGKPRLYWPRVSALRKVGT